MHVADESQESLRRAVKVVGFLENIPCHQASRIEGSVESGANKN